MLKIILAAWLVLVSVTAAADFPPHPPAANLPAIALIIDDLGNEGHLGNDIVQLPGPVACAFLPHAPYTMRLARQAHLHNKEVMLHLPMQAETNARALSEKGVLTLDMSRSTFLTTLQENLGAVPFVSGLNNHMGSLLTTHRDRMQWLMQSLRQDGSLFFVDSRTTGKTVAHNLAHKYGVPSSQRNVFLDNELDATAIRTRFRELLRIARRQGTALGIGHPHALTADILRDEISKLKSQGVELISVSRLIELQSRNNSEWHAYSSR